MSTDPVTGAALRPAPAVAPPGNRAAPPLTNVSPVKSSGDSDAARVITAAACAGATVAGCRDGRAAVRTTSRLAATGGNGGGGNGGGGDGGGTKSTARSLARSAWIRAASSALHDARPGLAPIIHSAAPPYTAATTIAATVILGHRRSPRPSKTSSTIAGASGGVSGRGSCFSGSATPHVTSPGPLRRATPPRRRRARSRLAAADPGHGWPAGTALRRRPG